MKRREILEKSLEKKRTIFNDRFRSHWDYTVGLQGEPIGGPRAQDRAIRNRLEREDRALRRMSEEVKKTERALAREERKEIDTANAYDALPEPLRAAIDAGLIVQWRRHPNTFFVPGVEKGRLAWIPESAKNAKSALRGTLVARYAHQIPDQAQYAAFRDVANALWAALKPQNQEDDEE